MPQSFEHAPPVLRGQFRSDEVSRALYAESAGILRALPVAVAVPADVDDVRALVRWTSSLALPLIPRGSGSSMSGGAVGDGVVVDLSRLSTLSPVDNIGRTVWGDAGVTRRRVEHAANAEGLRFPVDPSSGAFATIGGMTSTNAAGPHTMTHGAMRRWVAAIDCVFDDGSHATIRRGASLPRGVPALDRWSAIADAVRTDAAARRGPPVRKESSGYGVRDFAESGDLVDLLVGSEGTLALFTAVELRLAPMPSDTASVLVAWSTLEAAVDGAARARAAGAATCELLDRTFLDVARSGGSVPVPNDSECVLLVEFESDAARGDRSTAADAAQRLATEFESLGALAVLVGLELESQESLWALRHAASPILSRLDPHLKSMQVVEDGCVPPERLGDYVRGVRAVLDANRFRGVIFGHAGDAHVHVNALVDVREVDWRERVRRLFDDVVQLTASLGGSLAGEHGDGRLRTPSLARTWPVETRALFARIKQCFDPAGILNPGVIVPLAMPQDPLSSIKYDPALSPLPASARAVLDRVERERAYDSLRLEMLEGGG